MGPGAPRRHSAREHGGWQDSRGRGCKCAGVTVQRTRGLRRLARAHAGITDFSSTLLDGSRPFFALLETSIFEQPSVLRKGLCA